MNEHRGIWRGKRLNNGERVEGLLTYRSESTARLTDVATDEEFWVDSSTLGECTGLTDKNGKLIFEGDIIEHKSKRYVIKYIEKYMRFSPVKPATVFAVFDYTQSEIIGNVHDNPELMQKGAAE